VTPLPLHYADSHIEQIFTAVENNIPLQIGTNSIGGATGPITIAGNLVNLLATSFAGLVLSQLIKKGSFCMDSSIPCFMDPATANISGLAESTLAEMARRQILRRWGIPMGASLAGVTTAADFNQDGVATSTVTMFNTFFQRGNHYNCIGVIEMSLTYSAHALLLADEMASLVRHLFKGIKINNETLALEVINKVGHGGDYLAEMHTATNCRSEIWKNRFFKSQSFEQWEKDGKKDLKDLLDESVKEIMKNHCPEPITDSIKNNIDTILKKYRV